jgi:hypothetical protein
LECATFFLGHNAEPDTKDLFVELDIVNRIASLVDANTFGRVCEYMDRYIFFFNHNFLSHISLVDVLCSPLLLTMSPSCAQYTRSTSDSPNSPKLSVSRSALKTPNSYNKTSTPPATHWTRGSKDKSHRLRALSALLIA